MVAGKICKSLVSLLFISLVPLCSFGIECASVLSAVEENYLGFYADSLKPSKDLKSLRKREYKRLNLASDDYEDWKIGQAPFKLLGEGTRALVVLDGKKRVYKVANDHSDAKKIESEYWINKFLSENYAEIGIRVDKIVSHHPQFLFLEKELLDARYFGENIKKLSGLQKAKLEQLFNNAKNFAEKYNIGLDLKSANLFWDEKVEDWVLFDTGSRTSYLPFGFTTDLKSFKEYLKIWQNEEPE